MKSDIEIAQEAQMVHIREVAAKLDIPEDDLELYGKYKAKLSDELIRRVSDRKDGKLILDRNQSNAGGRGKDHHERRPRRGIRQTWEKGGYRVKRAVPWTVFWNQGRCSRRRIRAGCADGGSESALYR